MQSNKKAGKEFKLPSGFGGWGETGASPDTLSTQTNMQHSMDRISIKYSYGTDELIIMPTNNNIMGCPK